MSNKNSHTSAIYLYFRSHKNGIFFLSVIFVAIWLVYYKSLFNGLIEWDDYEYIINDKLLYNLSWNNIISIYKSDKHITLSLLSIAIQIKFTGLNTFYLHLGNVILHCINIFLVYLLSKKLSKNTLIAGITAALFALHPTRMESVAWVMERKDLLYTLFYLTTLITYIFHIEKKKKKPYLIFIVFACGWLSSVSKIQALTLPFVLLLFDYYYGRKLSLIPILEKFLLFIVFMIEPFYYQYYIPVFIILFLSTNDLLILNVNRIYVTYKPKQNIIGTIKKYFFFRKGDSILIKIVKPVLFFSILINISAFIIIWCGKLAFINKSLESIISISTYWAQDVIKVSIIPDFIFFDRIFLFSYSVLFYIYQLFNPFNLCAMHPYPIKVNGALPWEYYASGVILLLVFIVVIYFIVKRKTDKKLIIFGFLFFLINIFIVGHIFPIKGRLIAADRYSYLAYFGLFFLAAYFINNIIAKRHLLANRIITISLIVLLAGYSFYSYSRVAIWKNTYTFWIDVLNKQPENYYAYYGIGNYYLTANDNNKAIEYLQRSVQLNNQDPMAFNNLGLANYSNKNYTESVKNFSKAIELTPDFSQGYNNRGNAYYYLKDFDNALLDYKTAFVKWDKNTDALMNKADLELELKKYDSAYYDYKACIRIDSNDAIPFQKIGSLYIKQNNYKSAIIYLKKSLLINPGLTKSKELLSLAESKVSSGSTIVSDKNNNSENYISQGLLKAKSNDFASAIDLFSKAIQEDPTNATAYKDRGNAKAAMKNYAGSIEDFNSSISLNPNDAGVFLNRGNSKFKIDDKSACEDWKQAAQLGKDRAKDLLLKYCK